MTEAPLSYRTKLKVDDIKEAVHDIVLATLPKIKRLWKAEIVGEINGKLTRISFDIMNPFNVFKVSKSQPPEKIGFQYTKDKDSEETVVTLDEGSSEEAVGDVARFLEFITENKEWRNEVEADVMDVIPTQGGSENEV